MFEGLSVSDQKVVTTVWAEMLRVLGKPTGMQGAIDTWFGANCPPAFRTGMPAMLRQFRSCMNLCTITLCCSTLEDRDVNIYGAAYHNLDDGFAPIVNFDPNTQPSLRLELDGAWNVGIPMYRTANNEHSAFVTIAHELSHLLLGTDDHPLNPPAAKPKCYGARICLALAESDDDRALTNAENWGYFIEELRG